MADNHHRLLRIALIVFGVAFLLWTPSAQPWDVMDPGVSKFPNNRPREADA
jgi:hypothetical protein